MQFLLCIINEITTSNAAHSPRNDIESLCNTQVTGGAARSCFSVTVQVYAKPMLLMERLRSLFVLDFDATLCTELCQCHLIFV